MQLWLARRQVQHVAANRAAPPAHFATRITLAAHQKAADYTIARTRLGMLDTVLDAVVLLALTLGGGLAALAARAGALPVGTLWQDVATGRRGHAARQRWSDCRSRGIARSSSSNASGSTG